MKMRGGFERIGVRMISPIREFISDSRAVGITLIICTIISLAVSNSPWSYSYIHFWETELAMPLSHIHLPHTILHIINDALMAMFFFLAGLEIKRELIVGELSTLKKSMLPVLAAVGGMVVPAFIYFLWCGNTPYSKGWGIPMATDIAFSLGVLSLLGRKAPLSFRIFLTALAIIDDLGGILMIGIFYAGEVSKFYLGAAAAVFIILVVMNLLKIKRHYLYFIPGVILWYLIFNSGVHATVAGVLLAFTIPLQKIESLEHALHDPVNFIILPLFALANTAIALPADILPLFASRLHFGVFTGLLIGKPIGIFLFSYMAIKWKIAEAPKHITPKGLLGIGIIAGIGFTMSIFIATLAFAEVQAQLIAKIAILGASTAAGIIGYFYILLLRKRKAKMLLQQRTLLK